MEKLRGMEQPAVGYFLPTNLCTSISVAPVEHASLEAVYIFFDTATYNEIERDVKVTKDTVSDLGYIHCSASTTVGSGLDLKVFSRFS